MNDDDHDGRQVDQNLGIWTAMDTFVKHINAHPRPIDEFRSAMVFILSAVKMDPDDLNQALCEAFTQFDETVVLPRREQAEAMLEEFRRPQRGQGRT